MNLILSVEKNNILFSNYLIYQQKKSFNEKEKIIKQPEKMTDFLDLPLVLPRGCSLVSAACGRLSQASYRSPLESQYSTQKVLFHFILKFIFKTHTAVWIKGQYGPNKVPFFRLPSKISSNKGTDGIFKNNLIRTFGLI